MKNRVNSGKSQKYRLYIEETPREFGRHTWEIQGKERVKIVGGKTGGQQGKFSVNNNIHEIQGKYKANTGEIHRKCMGNTR